MSQYKEVKRKLIERQKKNKQLIEMEGGDALNNKVFTLKRCKKNAE